MKEYTIEESFVHYIDAEDNFRNLLINLQSNAIQLLEHGDVESLIAKNGNEIMRLLMQGYLNQRSAAEKKLDVIVIPNEQERRHCRKRSRALATLFGEVRVHRFGYSSKELYSVFPLDAALNLPSNKYSQGLQEKVGLEAAKTSFDETVDAIEKNTVARIPKRQIEQITQNLSADFDDFYAAKPQETDDNSNILVMTTDGKGVVMRKEDLRDATRKAAEKSQHKIKTRLSKGEKRNRKRMATVASVYETEPYQRTAEQIMGKDEQKTHSRPKIKNKRVWASLRKTQTEVINDMFIEAEQRDPEHKKQRLVLVDGQESQLNAIKSAILNYGVSVVIILDFIHVLEYLWKAAYCFYSPGSKEAENWVMEHALALLHGNISDTAAGMRRSATRKNLSQEKREPIDTCANYLIKNKSLLDYSTALVNGWPIATGVIEGACRHLVKDRMDITGACWSLDGAEAVLRLRALHTSGDIEAYMKFHHHEEKQRNYDAINMAA